MNQGPKWDCFIKKTRGQKSHDTVSLNTSFLNSYDNVLQGKSKEVVKSEN
jgi:hypothetical protein